MTDENTTFELSRRKALAGIGGIGVASAGAGLGTSAYFSDEETFEGNSLTAGELDLKIDWQQRYHGPESGDLSMYGDAGRPWVNAHPDHDDDGIQSLDLSEYDSIDGDGVVTYEDAGANIQRYLTCETLTHDYEFGDRDALVELDDVKPGDSGEITFSYHLCDNPGYVWLCGDLVDANENSLTEPEANAEDEEDGVVELLDAIHVQTWYDVNCDNEFDEETEREVLAGSPTTLRAFLNEFEEAPENCHMLNPGVYPGIDPTTGCRELDPIEFTSDGLNVDGTGEVIRVDEGTVGDTTDNLVVWVRLEDPNNDLVDGLIVQFHDMYMTGMLRPNVESDLDEIIQFDWTRVDEVEGDDGQTYVSDDLGMCELVLEDDDGDIRADLEGASCSRGENDVVTPNGNGGTFASAQFSYCAPSEGEPVCFPAEWTFCLGFEWWIPDHVGNEIQSDSVSFDLGFYTEQCRHNDSPGSTLGDGNGTDDGSGDGDNGTA
ncbi:SipW-dependent-type signal peptide-containing protein [Halorubrum sp. F4]|uniref:SipW-dependent-type signal peptide-containing protein n=1 Tax=Halorubrum sp. F4 TaxID=2989715 RepID=UPI0024804EB5|nr:SipW-dependent-type signal peptide-containing protein [Halorubrum sp. F4]